MSKQTKVGAVLILLFIISVSFKINDREKIKNLLNSDVIQSSLSASIFSSLDMNNSEKINFRKDEWHDWGKVNYYISSDTYFSAKNYDRVINGKSEKITIDTWINAKGAYLMFENGKQYSWSSFKGYKFFTEENLVQTTWFYLPDRTITLKGATLWVSEDEYYVFNDSVIWAQETVMGEIAEQDLKNEPRLIDLGKWIDAREQDSYTGNLPSLNRDSKGDIDLYYCATPFGVTEGVGPDWSWSSGYPSDQLNHTYSSNNGKSWSNPNAVITAAEVDDYWQYDPRWMVQRNWNTNGQYLEYNTDYSSNVVYQKSENSNIGSGWGNIQKKQQMREQTACANSMVYHEGKYYMYFEAASQPSFLLNIYVAKADKPEGPFEVLTYNGWKSIPTTEDWKPIIQPEIITLVGEDYVAEKFKVTAGQFTPKTVYAHLYGAGHVTSVTSKDGKIYLYYLDSTLNMLQKNPDGSLSKDSNGDYMVNSWLYKNPDETIDWTKQPENLKDYPYRTVAISDNPTFFENILEIKDFNNQNIWETIGPVYFPEANKFYSFILDDKDKRNTNHLSVRESNDGIFWTNYRELVSFPVNKQIFQKSGKDKNNNTIEIDEQIIPIRDKYGRGNFDDMIFLYLQDYIVPNAPWGPFYGSYDIHAVQGFNLKDILLGDN